MENGPWAAGGAISEPELVVSGPVGSPVRPDPLDRPQRCRGRRPLGALLVGALAASAVWGAGLYAFGAQGPDLRGYRVSDRLCSLLALPHLATVFDRGSRWESTRSSSEAVDTADCSGDLERKEGTARAATLSASVVLHKRTDPGAEFDAARTTAAERIPGRAEVRTAKGPGDRAYTVVHGRTATVHVLDGDAEFTLSVSAGPSAGRVTPERLRPLVAGDAAALMRRVGSP
ncbi:hypothetical protein ACIHCV_09040 [Streptomyces sp. NPDC051956]|uniref:hypothetical protein n=1 Tax=Streptomyces sp. NPDC051956 TaxID=3365677 RepID=UPI0037D5790A